MKLYLENIQNASLFNGVPYKNLERLLNKLDSQLKSYTTNQVIYPSGIHLYAAGILLEGSISTYSETFWGIQNRLETIEPGHLFGEEYACDPSALTSVTAVADKPTVVLWFNLNEILRLDDYTKHNTLLIRNLMSEMAYKSIRMQEQILHTTKKTTKEKLMSYLSEESVKAHSDEFTISFDRQQLADYLNVERSAMSTVITEMKKEGLIETKKSHFKLIRKK